MTGPDYTPPTWYRPAAQVRRLWARIVGPPGIAVTSHEFARMSADGYIGSIAPQLPDSPRSLVADVDELAEAGALDEGSGEVFHPKISAWVDQWANDVDRTHDRYQSVLQWREGQALAEAARNRIRLEAAERELAALEVSIQELQREPPRRPPSRRSWPWSRSRPAARSDDVHPLPERRPS